MRTSLLVGPALLVGVAFASPALAAWPNSPFTSLPVCLAPNDQANAAIVSDGAGGAIVTWHDQRAGAGTYDIYAQHILLSGAVDPAWPTNGRALCTAANTQLYPMIVADGAGGAIVTWSDFRNASHYDIYAQHVLASGAVDPAWPINGRALCAATNYQQNPTIASDGAGGAIVTWQDGRGSANWDVYAQHVLASGAADPAWPIDGRAICTAALDQLLPTIASDGAGGAIVTWHDSRSAAGFDVYAQHVLASGAVDPAWPVDGRVLCAATSNQLNAVIVPDGIGGGIVAWYDFRSVSQYDIYAQHVLASGTVDGNWPVDGRVLCGAATSQYDPRLVSDGGGGAIACWYDYRNGPTNADIYAQHVLASGVVDAAWPADGRALCTAANSQVLPTLVSDGQGGALVSWYDLRNGISNDVYAQHVLASGAVDAAWPTDGRAVSTATGGQVGPVLAPDGAGGAIIAWQDARAGGVYDLYAQRTARYGFLGTPEAEIVSVRDVPNDQGGRVKVSWNASYLESEPYDLVTLYDVFRSVPPNLAASRTRAGAQVLRADHIRVSSFDRPGDLLMTVAAGTTYYWEYLATVDVHFIANYSTLAPTAEDSAAAGAPTTAFMIQARTAGSQHWESLPMSGYSVDNLPPAAPAPFTGEYAAGTVHLHWNRNPEIDLAGYRLYRGTSLSFVPKPANRIASPPDTGYVDAAGAPYVYKLTAVDAHDNESPVATLVPAGTVAVGDDPTAQALSFAAPSPNPAFARTTLRYTLPRAAHVRLAVYDAAGRQLRELASGPHEAGEHTLAWDLRDAVGRAAGAGLYFARLECEGRVLVRRLAVTP